jgi:nucleoside-diphosphate-sugar epimerase
MNQEIHTILGANGAIGLAVKDDLEKRNLAHRLVSRKNAKGLPNYVEADLMNKEACGQAVKGSSYVYLCIGLPYSHKVWEAQWEIIMQNVIDACSRYDAKLIFLDNAYMYANPLPIPFDESTLQLPSSKKGAVRKRTADILAQAMKQKQVEALIGRAPDFYGKTAANSVFYVLFLERILQNKNPQQLSKGDVRHTYANVSDLGRALVELALCEDCYQQVWHLPVNEPITMEQVLSIINEYLQSDFKIKVMPKAIKQLLSFFMPILKEAMEMDYQFKQEYIMSDRKFQERFPDFEVTPYRSGIVEMIEEFKQKTI